MLMPSDPPAQTSKVTWSRDFSESNKKWRDERDEPKKDLPTCRTGNPSNTIFKFYLF